MRRQHTYQERRLTNWTAKKGFIPKTHLKTLLQLASRITCWGKAPATKPGNLTLTSRTHHGRRETTPASYSLTSTHMLWNPSVHACSCMCAHVHTHNKYSMRSKSLIYHHTRTKTTTEFTYSNSQWTHAKVFSAANHKGRIQNPGKKEEALHRPWHSCRLQNGKEQGLARCRKLEPLCMADRTLV